jgi:tetratricopeptide (TPR) repeat protein
MKPEIKLLPLLAFALASVASAQVYPLSENSWSNPAFVQRFLGSYGFDTEVTPSITSEEKTVFEAIAPLIAGNPAQAIAQLQLALKPESSAALLYTLANLQFQSGNLPAAEKHYREAIGKFPNFLRAYKNLGVVFIQTNRYAEALPLLLKTVELGGQGADVFGLLAYSYLNTGNSVAALRAYEQALFFDPESRDWRMGRVQCLMNLRRYEEAVGVIEDLVEKFPNQKDLLMLQANAYIARDQPQDAAATLEILRASRAASPTALSLLGDIYLNFNQPDLALGAYQEALMLKDLGPDRLLRIARRLASVSAWSQLDDYLATLDRQAAGKLVPADEIEILNLKAQSDLAQQRNEPAAAKLALVVERDPLNGKALLLLADYYWKKGDIERAELHFERAAKIATVAPDALVQHARMSVSIREFKKAETLLGKSQLLKPQAHIAQYAEKVSAAARASLQ